MAAVNNNVGSLFSTPDTIVIGTHKSNTGPKAELSLGNGVKLYFPMIDVSKGSQSDRVQVEVTLNGDVNVSGGVNNGIGSYQMQFLDGPLVDLSKLHGVEKSKIKTDTAAQQYLSAKTLKDRYIKVKLFSAAATCNGSTAKFSSKPIAEFHGVATTMHITLSTTGNVPTIMTQLDAIGVWKAQ